ncbi:MAG TPA: hypothetical protein VM100_12485 [Longimicrobiales bacterium]|nr:hypothetical protein [Longimicrobiales bacterium]
MGEVREVAGIQIDEEPLEFTRREWRYQRIGWAALAVISLLGLTGVLGHGPAAHETVGNPNTFAIEFDRIVRHGSPSHVVVDIGPGLQRDSTLRIYVNRDYLEKFKISDLVPQPESSGISGNYVYYEFLRPNPRARGRIVMHVDPNGYWHQSATVALSGATSLKFGQLILP